MSASLAPRRGFSILELLIASAVLGVALLPVISMANHNVEMLRSERLRLLAEALSHDILERVGRSQSHPSTILQQSANPKLMVALDPWIAHPELFDGIGYPQMDKVAEAAKMHMSVSLERGVAPELDLLVCEVSWVSDGWSKRAERFKYSRFLTYGHMPAPR